MKTEQLACFEHTIGSGVKMVRATEFTLNDGSKQWRVCIIIDNDAKWSSPTSRSEAIQLAETTIARFVKYLNELYNGD